MTALDDAIAARDKFLEEHPKHKGFQEEIDRILDNSGNQQGRMAVLGTLMQGKLLELQQELCRLKKEVIECQKKP